MNSLFPISEIPPKINDNEEIIRGVYHPANFTKANKIKKNVFMPPPEKDELSVLRLNYSSHKRCKFHCKQIQVPNNRNYWGLSQLSANEIYTINGCNIIHTPLDVTTFNDVKYSLPEHADIKLPFTRPSNPNQPLEIEDDRIIEKLLEVATFYKDVDIDCSEWVCEKYED